MKRLLPLLTLAVSAAHAQCVMCFRTAAAQQMERARILNIGIIVMLIPPVAILAGFLYLAYRRNTSFAEPRSPGVGTGPGDSSPANPVLEFSCEAVPPVVASTLRSGPGSTG